MSQFFLRLVTAIALVLTLGPIVVILVAACSAGDTLAFPPPGLSLRWFVAFFSLPSMRAAFGLSLWLALGSATVAGLLGLLGAVYASRRRGGIAQALQLLLVAPLIFPTIILGLALLLLYRTIGVPTLPGLFIAHVVVCLPYAFRATLTSLLNFNTVLEEAGQSLGAGPVRSFILITLPIIWPGILSGWLFAFVVSFGELNTALFLTGPGISTLPIEIFSYLQFQGSQLVVAAASAVQILVIALILILAERLIGARRIVQR